MCTFLKNIVIFSLQVWILSLTDGDEIGEIFSMKEYRQSKMEVNMQNTWKMLMGGGGLHLMLNDGLEFIFKI